MPIAIENYIETSIITGRWCNGSIADSESVGSGSNPGWPALSREITIHRPGAVAETV